MLAEVIVTDGQVMQIKSTNVFIYLRKKVMKSFLSQQIPPKVLSALCCVAINSEMKLIIQECDLAACTQQSRTEAILTAHH